MGSIPRGGEEYFTRGHLINLHTMVISLKDSIDAMAPSAATPIIVTSPQTAGYGLNKLTVPTVSIQPPNPTLMPTQANMIQLNNPLLTPTVLASQSVATALGNNEDPENFFDGLNNMDQ
ncbi:hypothetical protein PRIPAC_78591 [Pristionchus pacificus]|uniref:Uncharacterized protein n=1 Tax=Pristionchus pacificus TaxID=54126 RepID=A0A2A6BZ45_PRIPA|nr:hypothetical protein PRIPAC_78591 [Pristionchus pacificus]|eukprot:PDM71043.1 hypothetical protein PRIPAC_44439 [Pristionchus pacificus]